MDNANQGDPLIPAGTEKNLYGGTSFEQKGQSQEAPDNKANIENDLRQALDKVPVSTEITFEELAAKKGFSTADDLAKAYQNLEADNTKARMSLAEIVKIRQEAQQKIESEEEYPQQIQTQEDALKVVERLVKKTTKPLEDRIELQNLLMSNSDAMQYTSEMAKVVKENPGISWNTAYKAAKFDELDKQSKEKGKQEAYQNIQQKQITNVGGGRPTSNVYTGRSLDELISDRSIPFSEVQKIMRERFSQ